MIDEQVLGGHDATFQVAFIYPHPSTGSVNGLALNAKKVRHKQPRFVKAF